MSLALEYEGKQGPNRSSKAPTLPSVSRPPSVGTSSPAARESFDFLSSRQPVTRLFQPPSLPNTRPLTPEQQIRRDKGLCYRCGEKFSPGHRCKPGTFAHLELMQEENDTQIVKDNNKNDMFSTDVGAISRTSP